MAVSLPNHEKYASKSSGISSVEYCIIWNKHARHYLAKSMQVRRKHSQKQRQSPKIKVKPH